MKSLSSLVMDFVLQQGACASGIATVETLSGGPASSDLTYVMPEAKSAVSFAVPFDATLIPGFLDKTDHLAHNRDNARVNAIASGLAVHLANYLTHTGHPSIPVAANFVYRKDVPGGVHAQIPDISLRYLAVRSGVGFFGLSGNVLTAREGAAIMLGGVLTSAQLDPTDAVPKEENYCDGCRLCMSACVSGQMNPKEETTIKLGNQDFSYSKRQEYSRCDYVCGGFTGLHPSGKWSTWSPGRFKIPQESKAFLPAMIKNAGAYYRRPAVEGGVYHFLLKRRLTLTCGNCQLICHPDKSERKRRYKMLISSGVIIQHSDGTLQAVRPDVGKKHVAELLPEIRALYEE